MVTYEVLNILFQFGIFLATSLVDFVAIIVVVTNRKNDTRFLTTEALSGLTTFGENIDKEILDEKEREVTAYLQTGLGSYLFFYFPN